MAPENAGVARRAAKSSPSRTRRRQEVTLSSSRQSVLNAYVAHLDQSSLRGHSGRTYLSAVRGYLRWLEAQDVGGDPLTDPRARDRAVNEYAAWLRTVAKRTPATSNKAMTVLDDFYLWMGIGRCEVKRADIMPRAPHTLDSEAIARYLRAAEMCNSTRNRAIALLPFYAGARIAEIAALNVADFPGIKGMNTSKDADNTSWEGGNVKGPVRLASQYGSPRMVPAHPSLWRALAAWFANYPGPLNPDSPLFLSRQNTRMTTDALGDVVAAVTKAAKLDDHVTANVLRRTFEAHLLRKGTSAGTVSYLMGHSRRKAANAETKSYISDSAKAIASLPAYVEPSLPSVGSQPDPVARARVRDSQLEIIGDRAVTDPDDTDQPRDRAIIYWKQGKEAAEAGELDQARNAYQASLHIATQLAVPAADNTEWQRDLAAIHTEFGDVMVAISARDLALAQDSYRTSLDLIAERAVADPDNLRWQRELQNVRQRMRSAAS